MKRLRAAAGERLAKLPELIGRLAEQLVPSRRGVLIAAIILAVLILPSAINAPAGFSANWAWCIFGFSLGNIFINLTMPLQIRRMSEEERAHHEHELRKIFEAQFEQAKRDGLVPPNSTATLTRMN